MPIPGRATLTPYLLLKTFLSRAGDRFSIIIGISSLWEAFIPTGKLISVELPSI